jgi:hypothetical protein
VAKEEKEYHHTVANTKVLVHRSWRVDNKDKEVIHLTTVNMNSMLF